jgi:hypothetical protein
VAIAQKDMIVMAADQSLSGFFGATGETHWLPAASESVITQTDSGSF